MGLEQLLVREAEPIEHAGTERLEEDVGYVLMSRKKASFALGLLQIDDGARLLQVQRQEDARRRVGGLAIPPPPFTVGGMMRR